MNGASGAQDQMTIGDHFPEICVTKENISKVTQGLPLHASTILRILSNLRHGALRIELPNGTRYSLDSGNSGPQADLKLYNWRLPRRALTGGSIGVAESYVDGDWDSKDVSTFLELFCVNQNLGSMLTTPNWLNNLLANFRHWRNQNTKAGSKKNISAHYDLGNDFYSLWLDPSMTYSSAIFEDGANSLEKAQEAKYASIATRAGVTKDSHVLEIGCGWGGFAEYAAGTIGARVTALTISREQHAYATKRMANKGLSDRVDIKFQDYRDETNQYDAVASIEMFEAVGERYWPTFFSKVHDCLKPGAKAGLQIITIQDQFFDAYRAKPDFIQRYIFPGGMLPSPSALSKVTGDHGLTLKDERVFPQDYAKTLEQWRLNFWEAWEEVKKLGFDDRFKRLWEFYFHYCEAGFRAESIDVRQVFYQRS